MGGEHGLKLLRGGIHGRFFDVDTGVVDEDRNGSSSSLFSSGDEFGGFVELSDVVGHIAG